MPLALTLTVIDGLWNFSRRQVWQMLPRVLTGLVVGTVGGLIGGVAGQALFAWQSLSAFYILGWAITGLLVGASLGVFDVLYRFVRQEDGRAVRRKFLNGLAGGAAGGLLGGGLSLLLRGRGAALFRDAPDDLLWSPSALGFVALGMCIGLMIGLAQVLFRESWVRVEAGFRAGREWILTKPEVTIGRGEGCDIALFADMAIDRLHARLVQEAGGYVLVDAGSGSGTYLNDARIGEPTPVRDGDAIRIGKAVLRFGERQKRKE
jgi:hypothetical protein